jgi:putative transposase
MRYSTDLTDKQWNIIKQFFTKENRGKHLQKQSRRELVNAVLYLNKTGCQWRLLPKDFRNYVTVWSFYRRAVKSGLWEKIMDCLVEKSRVSAGRKSKPTYSLIDSQSVKTTSASEARGIDGGKKVKGRKRHIVTDKPGHLLNVKVHAANIHDTVSGGDVFKGALVKYSTIEGCCADEGYRKTFENIVLSLGKTVKITEKIKPKEWSVLPQRWVVERTFAWANNSRRLSKDYEITTASEEAFFMISHLHTLIRRLGKL